MIIYEAKRSAFDTSACDATQHNHGSPWNNRMRTSRYQANVFHQDFIVILGSELARFISDTNTENVSVATRNRNSTRKRNVMSEPWCRGGIDGRFKGEHKISTMSAVRQSPVSSNAAR